MSEPDPKELATEPKDLNLDKCRKTMALSIKEGSFAGASQVLGDNYITPFALAINSSVYQIGIMNSIAGFILPLGQIFGSRLMVHHSRKQNLLIYVALQSFMWILVMSLGLLYLFDFFRSGLPYLLMLFVFGLNIFGGIVGPNWISLMGEIVPENERGRYFGKRNLIVNFFAITISIILAFLLNYLNTIDKTLEGFLIIFCLAGISRFISSMTFKKHYEPPFQIEDSDRIPFLTFLKSLRTENFGLFTVFMNLISFAQWVAGPFFGIYMLQILQFDFAMYVLIGLSSSMVSLFVYKIMGKFADVYGNRALLKLGALLIPLSPIMWIVFSSPLGIFFGAQIISGIGWTAFNLAASNFIFDNISSSKRGVYTAYYSMIVGFGTILGGLFGSLLMGIMPFELIVNYKILFGLSGVLRALVVIIMLPKIKEVRVTSKYVFNPRNSALYRWLFESRLKQPKN